MFLFNSYSYYKSGFTGIKLSDHIVAKVCIYAVLVCVANVWIWCVCPSLRLSNVMLYVFGNLFFNFIF